MKWYVSRQEQMILGGLAKVVDHAGDPDETMDTLTDIIAYLLRIRLPAEYRFTAARFTLS